MGKIFQNKDLGVPRFAFRRPLFVLSRRPEHRRSVIPTGAKQSGRICGFAGNRLLGNWLLLFKEHWLADLAFSKAPCTFATRQAANDHSRPPVTAFGHWAQQFKLLCRPLLHQEEKRPLNQT